MGKIIRMTLEEGKALYEKKKNTPEFKAEMERLRNIRDEDIDFSDCPEITEEDVAAGRVYWPGRGGARAGAGRKPTGNVHVSLRMPAEMEHQFRVLASKQHKSVSAVILAHLKMPKKKIA